MDKTDEFLVNQLFCKNCLIMNFSFFSKFKKLGLKAKPFGLIIIIIFTMRLSKSILILGSYNFKHTMNRNFLVFGKIDCSDIQKIFGTLFSRFISC